MCTCSKYIQDTSENEPHLDSWGRHIQHCVDRHHAGRFGRGLASSIWELLVGTATNLDLVFRGDGLTIYPLKMKQGIDPCATKKPSIRGLLTQGMQPPAKLALQR